MGSKGTETRQRMIDATLSLIERRGYYGTGLNQVLNESGTPRGSLYFHFPGGKDALMSATIEQGAELVGALIDAAEDKDARTAVTRVLRALGDRLESSGWQSGCPVATVALEVAGTNDAVQAACSAAYRRWTEALRVRLEADGRHENPGDLAVAVLALIEGALLLARTHRSREPLEQAKRTLRTLL
ncbi:TetR/AcrR family transcriptional regulator [Nocardia crassostreae]|uniref:TetR/AcrR family transcriptional regulator n=1 Tax=Nocardia crassostreae TaxID=53428 RepID=UPI00083637FE|nr:TetR/AcrR family transcriptional regulator [Nocardia crassostreae]